MYFSKKNISKIKTYCIYSQLINNRTQVIKFKQIGINHLRSYLTFRPKEDCSLVGHSTADDFCDHSFTPG